MTLGPNDGNEIATLASLKRSGILESRSTDSEMNNTETEVSNSSSLLLPVRVRQYHVDDFDSECMNLGPSRALAWRGTSQVLVEWKYHSSSQSLRLNQIIRLASLVVLLGKQEVYQRFHIPRCIGLVQDDKNNRVGMVYDVPSVDANAASDFIDLQTLIKGRKAVPLGHRFSIAKQLAIALYYLQSVHWLHKSLRSDTIITFQGVVPTKTNQTSESLSPGELASNVEDHLSVESPAVKQGNGQIFDTDTTKESVLKSRLDRLPWSILMMQPFYILGLDDSRPDDPDELSETLSISTGGHRDKIEKMELYSHPKSLQKYPSREHRRFRSEFDIYSLGVILLEIGLWMTASSIKREAEKRKRSYRAELCSTYCDCLKSRMGENYWRAVKRCLTNDFDMDDIPDGMEAGLGLHLAFEKQVVSELEKCIA